MGRLAIIAPLLFVVSSFSVIPNASCQNVADKAQRNQRPANATPVDAQPGTNPEKRPASENVQPADKQYPVAVKEMPPKELWDKVYVVLTGALVAAAFATLIAVWIQAVQTKKAAVAAMLNADYLRASAAAYLTLAETNQDVYVGIGVDPQSVFRIVNNGSTPAIDCRIHACTEIVVAPTASSPFVDFSDKAHRVRLGEPSTIDPGSGAFLEVVVGVGHPITPTEYKGLMGGNLVFAVWLYAEFADMFARRRYRNFGFYVEGKRLHLLPKYNDSGEMPAEDHKRQNPN